jgi:hypothetical protein
VFFPEGTVVEPCIDYGASVSVLKPPNPCKPHRILALEKLSERYSAQLLKRFGKIALKIFGKVFPFAFLDDVTAKLDNLKIIQVFDSIHSSVPSSRMNGVGIRLDGSIRNVSFDEFR